MRGAPSAVVIGSAAEVLEQPGLEVLGAHASRCRDQRPDFAPPDEPASTELDARQASRPCPAPDRLGAEADVRGRQDVGRLRERDPVGGSRHRGQSSPLDEPPDPEPPDEPEDPDDPEEPDDPDDPDEPEPDDLEEPEDPDPEPDSDADADEPSCDDSLLPSFAPSFAPSLAPSPEPDRDARVPDDAPRSFFAQPDPRKWIVGGANCLRIVPSAPHVGQKFGPDSLIPCRMSARVPQALQRYS